MKANLIEAIQNIEEASQMQFCDQGYLDQGHSIYAAYDTEDLSDIMFHGIYTELDELPDGIDELNGCQLMDVAQTLFAQAPNLAKAEERLCWLKVVRERHPGAGAAPEGEEKMLYIDVDCDCNADDWRPGKHHESTCPIYE